MIQIEICVEEATDSRLAAEAGADRIELCRELWCGGLTPTDEDLRVALEGAPAGGIRILVRERPEGFALTTDEVDGLVERIEHLRHLSETAEVPVGFVVGSITAEEGGEIDLEAARRFRVAAGDRPLVFHRAFDEVADQHRALDQLIELGYTGVLTTGGHQVADPESLRALVEQADGRIAIIASGGVRAHNVVEILQQTGAPEVHMRAPLPDSTKSDPQLMREIVGRVRAEL